MTRTLLKWTKRCLGWIVLGGIALALLLASWADRRTGYGTFLLRLTWNDAPFLPSPQAQAGAGLRVRDRAYPMSFDRPLRLRPGSASVMVKLNDFFDFTGTAMIQKNRATAFDAALRAKPGKIVLRNAIPGATIDGTPCGTNWVLTNAEIGRLYTVEATAPGHETNRLSLRIDRPGADVVSDLNLRPLLGGLALRLVPLDGTQLALDGVPRAPSDKSLLHVGSYFITAINPDYYPFALTVEVTAFRTNTVEVLLRPRPAAVAVEATPAVDFQAQDATGKELPVNRGVIQAPPGQTILTLSAKGYAPVRRELLLEPNQSYSWKARFEREGAAQFQKTKEKFQLLTTDPEVAPQLAKLGGLAWKTIRAVEIDTDDLTHGARQYAESCAAVTAIVQAFPDRGRAWTNEVRAANAIDYWLALGELAKATDELTQYTAQFGPKSEFDTWFGGQAGRIQNWQDKIANAKRYLPTNPGRKATR